MSTAAHTSVVRGPGTSTAFTNETCNKITANTVYEIATDVRRLLDPAVPPVVQVDADGPGAGAFVTASPSTYVVDYLFGRITFLADLGAVATVRISGSYLPALDLAGVTEWSYTASRTVLDDTTVNNASGTRTKKLGLKDVTGSLSLLELSTYDHDPGAGALVLQTAIDAGTPLLIEIAAGGKRFRTWVLLESKETSAGVDDLFKTSLNFTGAAQVNGGAGYSWET